MSEYKNSIQPTGNNVETMKVNLMAASMDVKNAWLDIINAMYAFLEIPTISSTDAVVHIGDTYETQSIETSLLSLSFLVYKTNSIGNELSTDNLNINVTFSNNETEAIPLKRIVADSKARNEYMFMFKRLVALVDKHIHLSLTTKPWLDLKELAEAEKLRLEKEDYITMETERIELDLKNYGDMEND